MAESWLRVRWYPSIGKETAREDPIRSPMAEASSLAKVVLPEPGQPAIPTQTLRESLRLLSTRREAVFLRLFLCLRRVKGGGLSQFDPCVGVVMGDGKTYSPKAERVRVRARSTLPEVVELIRGEAGRLTKAKDTKDTMIMAQEEAKKGLK